VAGGARELTSGLSWHRDGDSWWARAPDLCLRFEARDGRVRTCVVMLDGRVNIDLSGQPAAVTSLVASAAMASFADPNAWTAVLARALLDAAGRSTSVDADAEAALLTRVVGAVRFPMLAAAYDAGFATECLVARWARAALDATSASDFAATAFGTKTTRTVARAVGAWLTDAPAQGARLGWASLGLAMAGRDVCEPDDLAALIQHREALDETTDFSVDDVALLRWFAGFAGVTCFKRVALDALRHGQVRQLLRTAVNVHHVRAVVRRPLPPRLEEIERVALAVAVIRPRPEPEPPQPPRATTPAVPTRPRGAPRTERRTRPDEFAYTPALRAVDGSEFRDLGLCLPATRGQLGTWGRLLRNCLADFAPAVADGLSTIIGVRREGMLVGALELDRDGRIVQFLGARNRPLPEDVTRPVVQELVERGVVAR
jgi:hypothetical protein